MCVPTPDRRYRTIASVATLLLWSVACFAQSDSLELEQSIATLGRAGSFVGNARALLAQRAADGDSLGVRELVAFMDRRRAAPGSAWLLASERLTVLASLPALDVLRDASALRGALTAERAERGSPPANDDDLLRRLGSILRARLDRIESALAAARAPEEEVRFTSLLVNHLLVRGLRGRLALNDSVRSFQESAKSWRAAVAAEYFHRPYTEERFGAAFHAGYGVGAFSGDAASLLGRAHGAVLGVETYLGPVTLSGAVTIGLAEVRRAFTARGEPWPVGHAPMVVGRLGAGYELRNELLAVTPLVALDVHSLRAPEPATGAPTTGLRFGASAGALLGYRIPFDVGVHVDLRLRFTWSLPGLGAHDPALRGSVWLIDAGFALVRRAYAG